MIKKGKYDVKKGQMINISVVKMVILIPHQNLLTDYITKRCKNNESPKQQYHTKMKYLNNCQCL